MQKFVIHRVRVQQRLQDFHLLLIVVSVVKAMSRIQTLLTVLLLARQQSFWRDSDVREQNLFWKDVFRQEATPTKTDSAYTQQTSLLRMLSLLRVRIVQAEIIPAMHLPTDHHLAVQQEMAS